MAIEDDPYYKKMLDQQSALQKMIDDATGMSYLSKLGQDLASLDSAKSLASYSVSNFIKDLEKSHSSLANQLHNTGAAGALSRSVAETLLAIPTADSLASCSASAALEAANTARRFMLDKSMEVSLLPLHGATTALEGVRAQLADIASSSFGIHAKMWGDLTAESQAVRAAGLSEAIRSVGDILQGTASFGQSSHFSGIADILPAGLFDSIRPLQERMAYLEEEFSHIYDPNSEDFRPDAPGIDWGEIRTNIKKTIEVLIICIELMKLVVGCIEYAEEIQRQEKIDSALIIMADNQAMLLVLHEQLSEQDEAIETTTTTEVNLRTGPSVTNDELAVLPPGTKFFVTRERDGWSAGVAHFEDGTQKQGWVNSDFLVPELSI